MKPNSSRIKTLLRDLLLIWKKNKKNHQEDPEVTASIQTLLEAQSVPTPLSKETVHNFESLVKRKKKRPFVLWLLETSMTLLIALCLAVLIRQMWFELYEIPTGSMRPTFLEKDRVLVSKTAFGLNTPLMTSHLTFSPKSIKRGSIVVLTGDKLALPDTNTTYFGIFPAKKRYVKRLVGLPGEYLYFYGGDIYCLKADGKTIERLRDIPEMSDKEFVPFLSFEGKIETGKSTRFSRTKELLLYHFNMPIGKVEVSPYQTIKSYVFSGGHWIEEFSDSKRIIKTRPQSMSDFWGMGNFAKCRFLLHNELPAEAKKKGYDYPHAAAYLEIQHTPSLPSGALISQGHSASLVQTQTTYIPLMDAHIEALAKALTTARFVIADDKVHRYHFEDQNYESIPLSKHVPDGTYEFIKGTLYKIGFGGKAHRMKPAFPLYTATIDELCFWFNAGIDMYPEMLDSKTNLIPSRFAYFRNGNLFVMGKQIMSSSDPILDWFRLQEFERQAGDASYTAFQDHGSPETNSFDPTFFKAYGLFIPKGHYLVLGDNHAMSVDGRVFGPIPEANIQGTPVCILWPWGKRMGAPAQPSSPLSPWNILFIFITCSGIIGWKYHLKRQRERLIGEFKQPSATKG